jgi:arylformamidase
MARVRVSCRLWRQTSDDGLCGVADGRIKPVELLAGGMMAKDPVQADPVHAYWSGQVRPGHPALHADYNRESAAAVAALQPTLDVPYGPHPRETFDVFRTDAPSAGTLIWFHGGYWQSRDKAQFHFLASAFVARQIDVIMVNYPLCPGVTFEELVKSAKASFPAIMARLGLAPGDPVVVAGHSAGGHLAAELTLSDWRAHGFGVNPFSGVMPVSGLFDLVPLLSTPINDKLGLDQTRAGAVSPLHRVAGPLPPAVFVVGGDETSSFIAQSADMHAAWRAAGGASRLVTAAGTDHYTVLRHFTPGHAAFDAALSLFKPH